MNDEAESSLSLDAGPVADVLERVTDAVFALDGELRFTFLNEQAERVFGRDEADLLGRSVWEEFPEMAGTAFQDAYEEALTTQEPVSFEEYSPPLDTWVEVRVYPSETGLSVYLRDTSDRVRQQIRLRERERTLRRAYEVITGYDRSFDEKIDALLEVVREAVGTTYGTLSRVRGDEYVFEAVAAPDDADLAAGDTTPLSATNCERVVATEETLAFDDIETDAPDLADRAGNAEWGIACYLGAPVFVDGEVYGTFCFYDMEPRDEPFSEWEVTFVDLLANWVSYELERQRHVDQLAVLDELNGVVREITDAVIDQSSREEIETVACRSLVDTDAYGFAWIGGIDQARGRVTPRTEAGGEGFLDDVELTYGGESGTGDENDDEDGTTARTPTERAIQTGTVQVGRYRREDAHIDTDTGDWNWDDRAEAYGFRSWAATPITDEGALYGVLNVHSDRPDAFIGQEQRVIEQLGGLIGHAITAAQRKEALMSDDVVEIEFEIRDAFSAVEGPDLASGTVEFDRTVPSGEGNYLVYGRTDEQGMETLRAIIDGLPAWRSVEVLNEHHGERRFELHLSEPPVVSVVAAQGGRVESARIEEGNYRLTVHLPHGADVYALVEGVKESYPDAEVIAQRQTSHTEDTTSRLYPAVLDDLTDRQRAAVESALYGGFFEWPRDSTGEDIAASMDISPATFHQHLRTGERKILNGLFTREE